MNPDGSKLTARIPLSAGVRALNPALFGPQSPAPAAVSQTCDTKGKPRGRAPMNKTEQSYANILEAKKRRSEIVEFYREGMTLRWEDGMTYTPDFWVVDLDGDFELIETKGPHIREDALVKFRAARDKWGLWFDFSMWQLTGGQWNKIL